MTTHIIPILPSRGVPKARFYTRRKSPRASRNAADARWAGLLIACLLVLTPGDVAFADQHVRNLPDIGDPAAAALPLSKEQKLGDIFVRELRAKLPLISDIEINEYLTSLGTQLANSSSSAFPFHFLLARSPQVNAFATLGGVITVNSGLWLLMENESQLVGVLAHEIAHVTQRHLARFLEASNRLSWTNALTLLSVILAAAYDPELGHLGLHTSIAVPLEQRLSYTRNHEREADNIGMQIMANADFHPEGVPEVFQHLHTHSGSSQVPEFLRTHPLTINRISDALNRLGNYRGSYHRDSDEFQYAKARLYALTEPNAALQQRPSEVPLDLYQRAIALTRLNKPSEAQSLLEKLNARHPTLPVKLALAQAHIQRGDYQIAHTLLEELHSLYPHRETVAYYYALVLLKLNRLAEAAHVLNPVVINQSSNPIIDKLRAEIASAQNKAWLSHEYTANYLEANGRFEAALQQLDRAATYSSAGAVFLARIDEKRKQIKQLQETAKDPLR